MRRSRYSQEQIIGILKEDQTGIGVADLGPAIRTRFPTPPNRNFNLRCDMTPLNSAISMRSDLGPKPP